LCAALALHVTDEALTGFLSVYNPTVRALRSGLTVLVCFLFLLTPLFFRAGRPVRPLAAIFAVLMIGNGMGHVLGTIAGQTVASVSFPRPMPGFWSSPFLIAAAVWVLVELRRTRNKSAAD
jgi:hypothetical protein